MFKYLIFIAICVYGIPAQQTGIGRCPKVDVQKNFDLNAYLGTWYEAEKYLEFIELGGKCIEAIWSVDENNTIHVIEQMINAKLNFVIKGHDIVKPAGNPNEGKFEVFTGGVPFGAPYWVLETDYKNYSVVFSCTQVSLINAKFAWILTRERKPSEEVLAKAHAVFDKYHLSKDLLKTNQENCPGNF
ncbi:hypothetical protein WA026_022478 [Henosepilachna vigintioctopunctata]|uniref:Apolipoprotein D n=1 Tax=Henosepilachna vigintioctopunctata TaxID=420089 RepID=A0AAW1TPG1_9CUCU